MGPTYQVSQLPGDSSLTFNLITPYVAASSGGGQQNLTGLLVARSTPGHYGDGQLEAYETPQGAQLSGPAQASSQIHQDTAISNQLTALNRQGETVGLGTLLTVPVGQSLLYIRPLYVSSTQNPLPQLADVIVVYNKHATMEPTLSQALAGVLGRPVTGLGTDAPGTASPSAPAVSSGVESLLDQAGADLGKAQGALRQGDNSAYQADVESAQVLVTKADRLASMQTAPKPAPGGAAKPASKRASAPTSKPTSAPTSKPATDSALKPTSAS